MDVTPILDPLNDAQREAVSAESIPMLVLAGAGSGKTRVLVHRVAWLIQVENVSPHGLLAVTFTNKAAAEMRGRIEQLLGMPASGLWVGTFHGLAHRLLRMHWQEARLAQDFQILDSDDQQRLIKRILKTLEVDESRYAPREVQWFINSRKDEGLRPEDLVDVDDPVRKQMGHIYSIYQEACERSSLVDFAELLLRAHELWRDNPTLLQHYQHRFGHVLVDEFQDTNAIQYGWLRLLIGDKGIPFAVGDDDQSIYGWRGARVENIRKFQRDFPATTVVKLEQNYRSTGNILGAANAVIANNQARMGKNLWTAGKDGMLIRLYSAFNERDEADFVINRIREWVSQGNQRSEAAILYRSNAQSRVFEEALLNANMPYRVYGGLRFFDRAEIKDALAYLRLVENPNDDASFERVVNHPTRGIGASTLSKIRSHGRAGGLPMWVAAKEMADQKLPARAANAIKGFLSLIGKIHAATRDLDLHEQVDRVINDSGLIAHFQKEKGERGEARIENLEELVSAARGFQPDPELDMPMLAAFLSHAALEAGENQADAWEDCVQLMTLHSAKGLEFPMVFLCGLEDGLFPHTRSIDGVAGLEEERRLCYVGMTRAMQELYITHAEQRRMHGNDTYGHPSRFIGEIPSEFIEEIRPQVKVSRPVFRGRRGGQSSSSHSGLRNSSLRNSSLRESAPAGIKLGQRVRHRKFGEGMVLNYEGQGAQARVQVNFEKAGSKWLVLSYANLEVM